MQTVTSNDGTAIAYDRYGDGPAVILIGGAFNDRQSPWSGAGLASLLAPEFTVYAYDRRGRGDSGDAQPYAVDREIEDLRALAEVAGGPVRLFGHSSGAALALQATAAGLAVERLALFEPPYTAASEDDKANSDLSARIRTLVAEDRRGDAVEAFQLAIGLPLELVAEVRNAPFRPALEAIAHTLVYDLAVLGSGAVPADVASKVDVPTLTIVGGASPEPLQAAGRGVAAALPNGRLHVIEGSAHNIGPDLLAPILRDYFSGSR